MNAEKEPSMSRPWKKRKDHQDLLTGGGIYCPDRAKGRGGELREEGSMYHSLWVHTRKKHTLYKGREKGAPLRWACSIGRYQWEKWNGKPAGEESSVMRCRPQIGSYYVYLRVTGKTLFFARFLCRRNSVSHSVWLLRRVFLDIGRCGIMFCVNMYCWVDLHYVNWIFRFDCSCTLRELY